MSASEGAGEAREVESARAGAEVLIAVRDLKKTFKLGLFGRRVDAVKGVSFEVHRGEIFGFLGPNGAGKTTTIKMLTGLIKPTGGEARLFGERVPSPSARRRLGFLPENPYVYPYLTPREFVELCGRLSGLKGRALGDRTRAMLDKVGILYAADRPVRRLSKGMLQRTGLAAALVADPELLVLDEPMSGLDPVGRKEVRDLILEERAAGRTIFFSTHILSDVEAMCDRVAILREGQVVVSGALRKLLRGEVRRTDVTLAGAGEALVAKLEAAGHAVRPRAEVVVVEVEGEAQVGAVLREALDAGAQVIEVTPRRETLEDLFMRRAL
ncbi:ABC transporter ATP-binding protein [Polyangium aurulentum]|uniref:ABC transporter ATP-binding protein n=1 Tax=Polyangium aurulentum TaxID=2567896 RepID=UPI0010AE3891|nr:ABC transporter ATP-binding protein [Polyangium aurulentum]UQA59066.1 ABC transporter ATP-binding protein [Polyangium aurulentum]